MYQKLILTWKKKYVAVFNFKKKTMKNLIFKLKTWNACLIIKLINNHTH